MERNPYLCPSSFNLGRRIRSLFTRESFCARIFLAEKRARSRKRIAVSSTTCKFYLIPSANEARTCMHHDTPNYVEEWRIISHSIRSAVLFHVSTSNISDECFIVNLDRLNKQWMEIPIKGDSLKGIILIRAGSWVCADAWPGLQHATKEPIWTAKLLRLGNIRFWISINYNRKWRG